MFSDDAFNGFNFTSLSIVGSNLSDVTFLTHLTAERLDLASNYFPRSVRFPASATLANSCRYIKLADSNLFQLQTSLVSSLRSVQIIDFSGNGLTSLDGATLFRATPNLMSLDLSRNPFEMSSLQDDFSSSLFNLRTLNLSRCGLTSLSFGLFRGADQLRDVDLTFNRLQIIPKSIETYLNSISRINLTGNPLHCNCENIWFRQWLGAGSRKNLGVVKCVTPSLYDKSDTGSWEGASPQFETDVLSRSEEEFRCSEPRISQITLNQNVDEGTDFLLNCVAQSDPAADVVWTSPFGESFRQVSTFPVDNHIDQKAAILYVCYYILFVI